MALAADLDRTPSAVALKMTNFASLDPTLHQSGMRNSSKLDRAVWTEFFDDAGNFSVTSLEQDVRPHAEDEAAIFRRDGIDVMRLRKTRVNQDFFRSLIMASYDNKCAVTGIDARELLIASHIVPWSEDQVRRIDPSNGICLNALHDRAFDLGLMTFDEDLTVRYSPRLPAEALKALTEIASEKLRLPRKFIPSSEMLAHHRNKIFLRS